MKKPFFKYLGGEKWFCFELNIQCNKYKIYAPAYTANPGIKGAKYFTQSLETAKEMTIK